MSMNPRTVFRAGAVAIVAGALVLGAGAARVVDATAEPVAAVRPVVVARPASPATQAPADPLVAEGEKLFVAYNCADCHGAGGVGVMAPSLADGRWKFGGSLAEVERSITEGRPEGMPAWGKLIDARQVHALAAYVKSLEAGKDVTTENFTGALVERTGH